MRQRLYLISGIILISLFAFGIGRWSVTPEEKTAAAEPMPVPGERSLELAQVRFVTLRLSATDDVAAQIGEAEATVRRRLGEAGVYVVPFNQPHDAVVWAHIDAHHFRAFDAHGVASELHLTADHKVRVDDELRVIPHDIWQADTTRLVQKELIPREVVQATDELAQQLASALRRARSLDR